MKSCPKCKRSWPDTGKFCPMDGTPLVAAVEEEPATVRLPADDAPASKVAPAKSPGKTAGAPRPAAATHAEPVQAKPQAPEPEPRRAEPRKAEPAREAPKPPQKKRAFSETRWFMVGEAIEEKDLDPDTIPPEELQRQYRPTSELPPEVRRKFSLTYGQEEKGGDDKGKKK